MIVAEAKEELRGNFCIYNKVSSLQLPKFICFTNIYFF